MGGACVAPPLFFCYNILMIKLLTYTSNRDKFLQFKFNNPYIYYNEGYKWVQVTSEKQRLVFSENSFIAFDDEISMQELDVGWGWLSENLIQEKYFHDYISLVIFSSLDTPLLCLSGKKIHLIKRQDDFTEFEIDDKKVYLYNFRFMTLARQA